MASTDPFVGLQYNWSPTTENFAAGMDTNIKTIGAVLQLTVQSKTVNDPATLTPINGQAWIVGPTPTGLWASHSKKIAAYIGVSVCGSGPKWPTPTVCGNHNRKGASKTSGDGLATAVAKRARWATPTAHDAKDTGTAPSEGRRHSPCLAWQAGGKLNPQWVEWLIGWPVGWTDLGPLEMVRYLSWQQQHGIF